MAGHVVPIRIYVAVFAALMVLTAVTTAIAFVDLGHLNAVLMLSIAVTKSTLVVLYFMHVRYGGRLTWVVVSSGVVWLLILIAFTMSDFLTRDILG